MKRCVIAIMSTACLAAAANAQVVNGGFETGDTSGWTLGGNNSYTSAAGDFVHSGDFSFEMGPLGSHGFLEQVLPLAAGTHVVLDFWLAHDDGTPNFFSATIDNQTVLSLSDAAGFDYTEYSLPVTISHNNPVLHFEYQDDPAYYYLDDVSVTPVPAPGAAALLGLGGVLVGRRRR